MNLLSTEEISNEEGTTYVSLIFKVLDFVSIELSTPRIFLFSSRRRTFPLRNSSNTKKKAESFFSKLKMTILSKFGCSTLFKINPSSFFLRKEQKPEGKAGISPLDLEIQIKFFSHERNNLP